MRNPNPASRLVSQPIGARLPRSAIPLFRYSARPVTPRFCSARARFARHRGAAPRPARLKFGSLCTMRHYVTIEGGKSCESYRFGVRTAL